MSSERKDEDSVKSDGGEREKSSTEVVRTVTEEEVDEFFKILRRVHVATRTAAKLNGGELPSKKRKRSQSLGLRKSLDSNGVKDGEFDGVNRVGLQGLDLNCKPEPDGVSLSL